MMLMMYIILESYLAFEENGGMEWIKRLRKFLYVRNAALQIYITNRVCWLAINITANDVTTLDHSLSK